MSVETCAEALTAIARPDVATVQIILNILRLKPLDGCCPPRAAAGVGIIARVPLASGLLSGRYDEHTDVRRRRPPHLQPARRGVRRRRDVLRRRLRHRPRGRRRQLAAARPAGATMAQFALRWILDQPGRHRRSSPAPATPSRPGPTPPPPALPPLTPRPAGRRPADVRRADPPPDPRPLVVQAFTTASVVLTTPDTTATIAPSVARILLPLTQRPLFNSRQRRGMNASFSFCHLCWRY